MGYKTGILDQSPIFPNGSASDALQETVNLAKKAEEWGYSRFWVSEHHDTDQLAGTSPEVLVSYLLAQTNSIRIGSGGVLLQHYSPYKVAENFHVLANLAPGRVDLGIGKAPGGLPLSTKALQYGTVNDGQDFAGRLSFLKNFIKEPDRNIQTNSKVQATPLPAIEPEIYLLGASTASARLAAEHKIPFVYGVFLNSDSQELAAAEREYHGRFSEGRFIVSVAVIAAPSQSEADQLASNQKNIVKVHLESGRTLKVLTREQAELFGSQAGERYEIEEQETKIIAGTPTYIKDVLDDLHQKFNVAEFILHTPIPKKAERFRSFELLSPQKVSV